MAADPVLRAADKNDHDGFRIIPRRVNDPDQVLAPTPESHGAFGQRQILIHPAGEDWRTASTLAAINSCASSISLVCQKGGPRTTRVSTGHPALRHRPTARDAGGLKVVSSREETSSHAMPPT